MTPDEKDEYAWSRFATRLVNRLGFHEVEVINRETSLHEGVGTIRLEFPDRFHWMWKCVVEYEIRRTNCHEAIIEYLVRRIQEGLKSERFKVMFPDFNKDAKEEKTP